MILALAGQLSNCLMNLKNSGDSTGFEPMTSAMPVQCSNQLSYEVTQWRAGQFAGLMFSRGLSMQIEHTDFIAQLVRALHRHRRLSWVRIPLSHLNFSGS